MRNAAAIAAADAGAPRIALATLASLSAFAFVVTVATVAERQQAPNGSDYAGGSPMRLLQIYTALQLFRVSRWIFSAGEAMQGTVDLIARRFRKPEKAV